MKSKSRSKKTSSKIAFHKALKPAENHQRGFFSSIQKQLQQINLSWEILLLAVFFSVGAFLRLWNFRNTLQFLGDQGRDVTIAKKILKDQDIVLIGPVTSTGDMYLGPLYYYLMVPFLAMTYPDPIGPAYGVAVFSILTLPLCYLVTKEILGKRAALIATGCMSISATLVLFSRFSWNPNPAPFFGLLMVWGTYRAITKKPWYWLVVSVAISFLVGFHYITLLSIPAAGLIWLWSTWFQRNKFPWRQQALAAVGSILLFILSLSPLIVFDIRHNFLNTHSLYNFVTTMSDGRIPVAERALKIVKETHGRSLQMFFELHLGQERTLNTILLILMIAIIVWTLRPNQKNPYQIGVSILVVYFVMAIAGLSVFRGSVFPHYVAYLFGLVFMIYGYVLDAILKWGEQHTSVLAKIPSYGIVTAFLLGFGYWNLSHQPLNTIGWTVNDMKRTADEILEHVKPGDTYNIILLSETKDVYGQNYRYFLNISDRPPVNPEDPNDAKTLYIINEQKEIEDPLSKPIYEIQIFPNKIPKAVYTVPNGPEIIVLEKK